MHSEWEQSFSGSQASRPVESGVRAEHARPGPAAQQRSVYGRHLMSLHTARRCLISRIEDGRCAGVSTINLEQELNLNRSETRMFLAYLEVHTDLRRGDGGCNGDLASRANDQLFSDN